MTSSHTLKNAQQHRVESQADEKGMERHLMRHRTVITSDYAGSTTTRNSWLEHKNNNFDVF